MKNRVFTLREKVMLLVLTVLLLAMGYWKLFYEPVQTYVQEAAARQAIAADQLLVETMKHQRLEEMQAELAELESSGSIQDGEIPDYDNVENVMVQLDAILSAAQEYSLTFSSVQFGEEGLVARPIQMRFTAGSYASARAIMNDLYHCWYRCAISDLSVAGDGDVAAETGITVTLTATFFERMN